MPTDSTNWTKPGQQVICEGALTGPLACTTYAATAESFSSSRVSVRTSGFNSGKLVNLPMNPFTFSLYNEKHMYGTLTGLDGRYNIKSVRDGYVGVGFGAPPAVADLTGSQWASLEAAAIDRLLGKLKDQSVNLAQAFAERKQVENMLVKTAHRLAGAFVDLKHGNYIAACSKIGVKAARRRKARYEANRKKDPFGAAANGWLELQYGWKPLLSDIYGAAEFLANKRYRSIVTKATASAKKEVDTSYRPAFDPRFSGSVKNHSTCQVRVGVYFSTNDEGLHTLAQTGFSNPALLAWELLPYSFVVDWFIPIGNYLSSFDATLGLTFQKGYITRFRKGQSLYHVLGTGKYYYGNTWLGSAVGTRREVTVSRVPLSSFPRASIPSFKNPFSPVHVANAIALLSQSFKR